MKRYIILLPFIAILILCLFEACKKETNPSRVVTISTPVIMLMGPADTTINRGATWVDPGASWFDTITGENGHVTATILGANYSRTNTVVNTTVDTAYLLTYIALNKNGFPSATLTRSLGVTNMSNAIDISGPYLDNNGFRDSVVKLSRALFYISAVDAQHNFQPPFPASNTGLICIKSDSTISVATIYTTDLTGAYVPEWFTQSSISYSAPITFGYTPNVLNVPSGSFSSAGIPMGLPVSFSRETSIIVGGAVSDSSKTKF